MKARDQLERAKVLALPVVPVRRHGRLMAADDEDVLLSVSVGPGGEAVALGSTPVRVKRNCSTVIPEKPATTDASNCAATTASASFPVSRSRVAMKRTACRPGRPRSRSIASAAFSITAFVSLA